jgi:hypothetical protein
MPESSPPPASRRFQAIPIEETTKKVRRFAPEPVETTTRSSKSNLAAGTKDVAGKKHLIPIPVETSYKSSRLSKGTSSPVPEPTPSTITQDPLPTTTPKPRRRFVPELIETSKRSKRAGDGRPATLPTDKVTTRLFSYFRPCADHCGNCRRTSLPEFQISTRPGQSQKYLKRRPAPVPPSNLSRSNRRHPGGSPPCVHTLIHGGVLGRTLSSLN